MSQAPSTGTVRPTLNPIRPPQPVALPKLAQLKAVFGAWTFHSKNHEIPWKAKQPAAAKAGVLKEFVISKPPAGRTGNSIRALVLKSDPTKVVFVQGGSSAPHYFGPVSWQNIPKGTALTP